ncbi:MAG: preprotein translocase subunit SecE [Gemmatimonadales bacterium]|nr:preprotein translocase subunit SecE [Gemmatimonadales bacterium]
MADAVETPGAAAPGSVARAQGYVEAVRIEMGKVTWPSREELVRATRMVLSLSVVLGLVIGLLDWLLQLALVDGLARLAR